MACFPAAQRVKHSFCIGHCYKPTIKTPVMAVATIKRRRVKSKRAAPAKKKAVKGKDLAASYNQFKEYKGQQYTGMQVGRSHYWNYDQGQWKETKITPDLWEISYAVTKRRKGKAPKGS